MQDKVGKETKDFGEEDDKTTKKSDRMIKC